MGSIKTDYAADDKYLSDDHNEENTQILQNQDDIATAQKMKEFDSEAGETIDGSPTPKAVCHVESTAEKEFKTKIIEDNYDSVNNTTWRGQLFAVPADVNYITTIKVKYNRPSTGVTGTVRWELRQNTEKGTLLGYVDVDLATVSTTFTEYTLTFNVNCDPSSNVVLIFKGISVSGGSAQWRMDGSGMGGTRKYTNDSGSSWGTNSYAHYFKASGNFNASDGVELSDASDAQKINFVGFVYDDKNALDATKVQYHGILGGFSGLTPKKDVFLSDTAGGISHTPGTYPVKVGFAISTTEIVVQEPKVGAGWLGNQTINNTTNAYTVPDSCNIVVISLSTSDDNSRFAKNDLILIRGIKTTAYLQDTYDGTYNKPSTTVTWSGNTLTFSGDVLYKSGTIHQFKNL